MSALATSLSEMPEAVLSTNDDIELSNPVLKYFSKKRRHIEHLNA